MNRIAKALAVTVPLLLAVACSDECKGPEDCAPGELCVRPVEADGSRGATQCVASRNKGLSCSTDMDCGTSGLFRCVAQSCVLTGTITGSAQDSGVADAAPGMDAMPAADATPGMDAAPMGTTCDQYCTAVLANCTGANAQFADRAQCLATCAAYPTIGTATVSGDSLECRAYHAGMPAMTDPATHCAHAGTSGGGVCGTRCEAYCDQTMRNCAANNAQYPSRAACLSTCANFPVVNTATVSGNSVECRTYHASFPAAADAATHCAHAGTSGGGVCGTRCQAYCDQAMNNCGTALYPDRQTCQNACASFRTMGMENEQSGNSVQCRTYHASFPAATDAMVHCPHAGIAGGGVCGTFCGTYCDFLDDNCTSTPQYADRTMCLATCTASIATTGPANAVTGNSVQCRSYHASFPARADPTTHCPHAGLSGGGICVP